jgi:hypothetical protein
VQSGAWLLIEFRWVNAILHNRIKSSSLRAASSMLAWFTILCATHNVATGMHERDYFSTRMLRRRLCRVAMQYYDTAAVSDVIQGPCAAVLYFKLAGALLLQLQLCRCVHSLDAWTR